MSAGECRSVLVTWVLCQEDVGADVAWSRVDGWGALWQGEVLLLVEDTQTCWLSLLNRPISLQSLLNS